MPIFAFRQSIDAGQGKLHGGLRKSRAAFAARA